MNQFEHSNFGGVGAEPACAAAAARPPVEIAIDASCRVPLLALFGIAALWLVAGLSFALVASLTFHMPWAFGDHAWLTYGRLQAAANDAVVYGFIIPAALGVLLWIFARLGETELALPLLPIAAANIWFIGVLVGVVAVFLGDSTGFPWLEFPRGGSVLIFTAYMLVAVSAMATFGARKNRALEPAHWFLLAALFWFPWIYATGNIFLIGGQVRGVAQAVIDWWFVNNLLFVWFALVGLGTAFYFLPRISGKPLPNYFALSGFWTLILFAPWCGIPQGAPVPAWFPSASAVAAGLLIVPLIAHAIVFQTTVCDAQVHCKGGPFCQMKFGMAMFFLFILMLIASSCPACSRIIGFTWFEQARTQLIIFGFAASIIRGATTHLMPRVMGFDWPFPKLNRLQQWLMMLGLALLVVPEIIGGVEQGTHNFDFQTQLPFLRVSTTGYFLLLLGALILALNIFVMTFKWKMALLKSGLAALNPILPVEEVKP